VSGRPLLLLLTAAAAGAAAVGNAMGAAAGPMGTGADAAGADPARTRLGVAIADDLNARDAQAARRGRALDLREQAMRAAEARMSAKAPAAEAETDASKPAGPAAPAVVNQFDDLARIYQAMKPAAAATVFEQLDLDVQMRVAEKMRDRSTALILAAMSPKGAAALTMAIARRQASRPAPTATAARR